MTIAFVFDWTDADPEAHNYAVKKLREKFGENGHCTLMDYIMLYGEILNKRRNKVEDET